MIKFFCDRCGKEVKNNYELSTVEFDGIPSDRCERGTFEICNSCLKSAYEFVKNAPPTLAGDK